MTAPPARPYAVDYAAAVAAFNDSGDLDPILGLMHPDVRADLQGGPVAGADAMRAGMSAIRDAGWCSHLPVAMVTAGPYLAMTFQNHFTDGRVVVGAAVARFDDDGLIAEMTSRGEPTSDTAPSEGMLVARYCAAVASFNDGDVGPTAAVFGSRGTYTVGGHTMVGAEQIGAVLQHRKDAGWRALHLEGVASASPYLVALGRADDDSGSPVAGVLLHFDDDGSSDWGIGFRAG